MRDERDTASLSSMLWHGQIGGRQTAAALERTEGFEEYKMNKGTSKRGEGNSWDRTGIPGEVKAEEIQGERDSDRGHGEIKQGKSGSRTSRNFP